MGLMGHRIDLFNVIRNFQTVSKILKLGHFTLPLAIYKSFNCPASSPMFSIYQWFNFIHSSGYIVVPYCDFYFAFSWCLLSWALFHFLERPFAYLPLWSVYASIFPFLIGSFVFLLTSCRSQLCILDTSLLLVVCFTSIFSMTSFEKQNSDFGYDLLNSPL